MRWPILLTALTIPAVGSMAQKVEAPSGDIAPVAVLDLNRPDLPARPERGRDLWMPGPTDHVRPADRPTWEMQLPPQVTDRLKDKMMPWPEHPTAVDANRNYCKAPPIPGWKRFLRDQQAWADGKTAQGLPGRPDLEPYECDP